MLERVLAWIKTLHKQSTPEDLEARQEAKQLEDEVETTRVLGRFGPRDFTSDTEWKGE